MFEDVIPVKLFKPGLWIFIPHAFVVFEFDGLVFPSSMEDELKSVVPISLIRKALYCAELPLCIPTFASYIPSGTVAYLSKFDG